MKKQWLTREIQGLNAEIILSAYKRIPCLRSLLGQKGGSEVDLDIWILKKKWEWVTSTLVSVINKLQKYVFICVPTKWNYISKDVTVKRFWNFKNFSPPKRRLHESQIHDLVCKMDNQTYICQPNLEPDRVELTRTASNRRSRHCIHDTMCTIPSSWLMEEMEPEFWSPESLVLLNYQTERQVSIFFSRKDSSASLHSSVITIARSN